MNDGIGRFPFLIWKGYTLLYFAECYPLFLIVQNKRLLFFNKYQCSFTNQKSFTVPICYSILITLGLCFLCSIPTFAQKITVFDEAEIKQEVPVELKKATLEGGDVEGVIKKWYADRGFLNITIDSLDNGDIEIRQGCPFIFELEFFEEKYFGEYTIRNIKTFMEDNIHQVQQEGFYLASAEITQFELQIPECKVNIALDIHKGKQLFADEILFSGSKTNKKEYLHTISGFREPMLVTHGSLQKLRANLLSSELFDEVSEPQVVYDSTQWGVLFHLQETDLNQFDGVLGYVPNELGKGQVVGDINISLWNVVRQGNGISLFYQRLKPETTRLELETSQHWFGRLPIGVGFLASFYQNDTTYQVRSFNFNGYYQVNPHLRLTSGIGQINSVASISPKLAQPEPSGEKRYVEAGFRVSTLNRPKVPTRGTLVAMTFGVSNKSVEMDTLRSFTQRYVKLDAQFYIPLQSRSVVAFSMHGFYLLANQITENDMSRFGGANSLRGYSEEQFSGSQLLWGDIEYQLFTDPYSYLFVFGAVGGYYRPKLLTETTNTFKTRDFLYSFGFGVSYRTKIGRLKFSYAISPQKDIGNGKVHLSIVTRL